MRYYVDDSGEEVVVKDGEFRTADNRSRLDLSYDFLVASWRDGLWLDLNKKFNLLIDAYEEEEVPVSLLNELAAELRAFGESKRYSQAVLDESRALADFVERAQLRDISVFISL